jgi:hypothetical protein
LVDLGDHELVDLGVELSVCLQPVAHGDGKLVYFMTRSINLVIAISIIHFGCLPGFFPLIPEAERSFLLPISEPLSFKDVSHMLQNTKIGNQWWHIGQLIQKVPTVMYMG